MAFKMRGHTLPGINKRAGENMPDGRSKSAAFQYNSAYKLTEKQKALDVNKNNRLDADDFASLRAGKSPKKKYASDAQRKAVHASKAEAAMKKKGCKSSSYKMLNKKMKSNKPCPGCKTICPSCRGKK
jgi:hypothetical protein